MSGGTDPRVGIRDVWPAVVAVATILVLGFFLYSLRDIANPFLLYLLLLGFLVPFRGLPGRGLLIVLTTLLTLLWVLHTTGFLLAPFVLAMVLAYILDPVVDRLEPRTGRTAAVLLLALPVVGALVLLVIFGLPALGAQIADLISRAPVLLERLASWIEGLAEMIAALSLPEAVEVYVDRIRSIDPGTLVSFLEERQAEIVQRVWEGVVGVGRGLGSALTILGYVVLTPVLTFYLLRDWDRLTAGVRELIPEARRTRVVDVLASYDHLLSRYLRGQLTVALVVGTITATGLWIASFPNALLLGVLVAVFGLIPYLGLVLSLIPAVVIALLQPAIPMALLKVAIVYGIAQALEGSVVSPRIVGESVGLHPVWVVLALAIGGFYLGFVGLLIGVPLAVGVKLLVVEGLERYRASELYGGEAATEV